MIKDNLNGLIMSAMKAGDKVRTNALRGIKTGIMQWETAKNNVCKTYDETVETSIIRKLKDQYTDAATQCNDGKHEDLVAENLALAKIMEEFLPTPVSDEDIKKEFFKLVETIEPVKKNMKLFMNAIKEKLPGVDGKQLSQYISKNLG